MFRFIFVCLALLAIVVGVVVVSAQVAIPNKVVQPKLTQTGWHLDSVTLYFDGSNIVGLGTPQKVVAFFQGYQKIAGVKTAIPNLGLKVSITDSIAVKRIMKARVGVNTIREVIREAVFRQAKVATGVTDSSISVDLGQFITIPPDSSL